MMYMQTYSTKLFQRSKMDCQKKQRRYIYEEYIVIRKVKNKVDIQIFSDERQIHCHNYKSGKKNQQKIGRQKSGMNFVYHKLF